MTPNSDFNRVVSNLFTNSVFKHIAETGESDYLRTKAIKYRKELLPNGASAIKDVFQNAYKHLEKNYRNEYLYKNTIANNILLGKHSLRTATLLNEFKVAGSIADILIINGTSTVYEIKTELDSPEKLLKQIADYKKAFAKVFIVTHHSLVDRYLKLLNDRTVGILSLNGRFSFTTIREAVEDFSEMDRVVMMKMLRKSDYSAIIQEYFGMIPSVSNIYFFKECLQLVQRMDIATLHGLTLKLLAKRKPLCAEVLETNDLPKELKQICLSINPSHHQYKKLFSFLNETI